MRIAVVQEIRLTRKDLNRHLDELQDLADFDVAHLTTNLDGHAKAMEAQMTRAVDGWMSISQPIAAISSQVAEAAPGIILPLTDCESNPSCFENRWRGLTYDLEQTMRAVQKAAPEVAQDAKETSEHFAHMAESADKWVGHLTAPKSKKTAILTSMERIGIIGLRAWLLL